MSIDTINKAELTPGFPASSGSETLEGEQFKGILSELQATVESLQLNAEPESLFSPVAEQVELSDPNGNELPQTESVFLFPQLNDGFAVEDVEVIETSMHMDSEDGELGFLADDTGVISGSALDEVIETDGLGEHSVAPELLDAGDLMDTPAIAGAAMQSMEKSQQPQRPGVDGNNLKTAEFATDERISVDIQSESSLAERFGKSAKAFHENITGRGLAGIETADSGSADFSDKLSEVPSHFNPNPVAPLNSRADTGDLIAPLNKPVGHQAWRQDVGERLIWMTDRSVQSAEIRLNPAHLGPLQVRIDMDQDQTHVIFASQHSAVREALESAIPKLREMFGDLELNLGDVQIAKHGFNQQQESNEDHTSSGDQSETQQFSLDPNQDNSEDEVTANTMSGTGILNLYV